uniref:Cytochrome c-type biogenesis protein n=1 Tax=Candidatus Kentrum eta TaxID=2126337 RepID=A0A450VA27_9GAMM|nr:MAG: cytochrome c-type biogenesis protein CcmH [Candidatus Kentron sp. H]VFK01900.1 MAG: cytochrome c-type biogenesis protein CcmH [Candidatus Kentron sp. H]VFK05085.1 MAG: cytochrome c-type biogenesis protein CcmH [Candidatus Kentron sp. H]
MLFSLLIVIPGNNPAASVFEPYEFTDPAQAMRYKTLIEELRCLVCQNQSLADSNAALAADLRQEVYKMVSDGTDEDTVKAFMVSRYSEYVLYCPPVTTTTLLLWIGPLLFVLMGFVFLTSRVHRRTKVIDSNTLSETEEKRIRKILENRE